MTFGEFSSKVQKGVLIGDNYLRLRIDQSGFDIVDDLDDYDAIIGVITYEGEVDEKMLNMLNSIYNDYNDLITKMAND